MYCDLTIVFLWSLDFQVVFIYIYMGCIPLVTSPWIAFTVETTKPPSMDRSHRDIRQVIISVVFFHQVKWLCAMEDGTRTGEIMRLGFHVCCFRQKKVKIRQHMLFCNTGLPPWWLKWEKTPTELFGLFYCFFWKKFQLASRFGYIVVFHELQG